jgi:enoyl-[acyl-carrier-protein] reductase (NADH)
VFSSRRPPRSSRPPTTFLRDGTDCRDLGASHLTRLDQTQLARRLARQKLVVHSVVIGMKYSVAKGAVVHLSRVAAAALAQHAIRVNAICPGLVEGERIQRVLAAKAAMRNVSPAEMARQMTEHVSLRCFVTPHDIANMVLYLCSPFGRTISGQAIAVDGDTLRLG